MFYCVESFSKSNRIGVVPVFTRTKVLYAESRQLMVVNDNLFVSKINLGMKVSALHLNVCPTMKTQQINLCNNFFPNILFLYLLIENKVTAVFTILYFF